MTVQEMMHALHAENINTWFDLGLFIDRFKENRKVPALEFSGSHEAFMSWVAGGGLGLVSFFFSIDGASMEAQKYAKAYREIFGDTPLHYIAGKFYENGSLELSHGAKRFQVDEMAGFDHWPLYFDLFGTKLERGGAVYNELIQKLWREVLILCEKLGRYIEEQDIRLLHLINTNSNPGNVSLALALVFISEYLGLPVICNNHDFYWEGGHSEIDIREHGAKPGPRDHFFTNYHLGEVFSLLEMAFPWDARTWMSVNINPVQSEELIRTHGFNPANVAKIDTAIDLEAFSRVEDDRRKEEIFQQLSTILGGSRKKAPVVSVHDVLANRVASKAELQPMLIGAETEPGLDFQKNNIIIFQPTRILPRKTIEVNFTLIEKLTEDEEFFEYFEENEYLKITLLVSGPIATGQINYFYTILEKFRDFLSRVRPEFKKRIFLAFLFSAFDKPSLKKQFKEPVRLPELYSMASLISLPSETEGRGLPIIEAAACGVPVFCRRYEPEVVFAHVIGEHLPKSERLSVIQFPDPALNHEIIESVKRHIFSPKGIEPVNMRNREIVENRFGFAALVCEFRNILYGLYLQIQSEPTALELGKQALDEFKHHLETHKPEVASLLHTERRQYLPGYGQMAFMVFLKSLIDPSYFRVEEKRIRGMAMQFAKELVDGTPDPTPLPQELVHRFYNSIDSIFRYWDGELPIRIDHSMAYRHRNKRYYPYRDLTPQEFTGVINLLFNKLASPPPVIRIAGIEKIAPDWYKNLPVLFENVPLAIDHIDELEERLRKNVPIALFPGDHIELELELFVLYPIRKRLKLAKDEKIHTRFFDRADLAPIYIIQHENARSSSVTAEVLKSYVHYSGNTELKLLFEYGICRIISSRQQCIGIHFHEMGPEAAQALHEVQRRDGFLIAFGDHAAVTTDIVDLDRFHIGKVNNVLAGKLLGIPQGSGYVQWVPAGLRFNLAYPTPVQTGKVLSNALKSFRYKKLCDTLGEKAVFQELKKEAEQKGTPVKVVLKRLSHASRPEGEVTYSSINGIYADGLPWAGVIAKIGKSRSDKTWHYAVVSTDGKPKTVVQFVREFDRKHGIDVRVAWNGGYILNAELVGKLGIPEKFIGSPLGLIISEGRVIAPPLFNKPALMVLPDGRLQIQRVNCSQGITISGGGQRVEFSPEAYNPGQPPDFPCFYDLLFPEDRYPGDGRVLVRLAGNTIKDIIRTERGETVPVLPVGLTLSFPAGQFPAPWEPAMELAMQMRGWEAIEAAIEAGPQLLHDGKVCIDMEAEGWKTQNSINTQAARLDYLDMRGPKIAVGLDAQGDLSILTINGRIRESVGATHGDMAEILRDQGIVQAMGFDPGGSSTLVVDNKTLNISPYNHDYEKDVYSLPPEPRAVANAVLVW